MSLSALVHCRATILRNALDEQIKTAPWRVLLILGLLGVIWVALYMLLYTVFTQVRKWELAAVVADQTVFIYFFMVLAVMLAFSNAILSFGSLFGRDEPALLLSMPARTRHVVFVKWLEGMFLSSWSFMLLGVPLMFAVATTAQVRWYFYPLFIAHFAGFAAIPGTIGLFAAWAVAMWAPRRPAPTAIWIGCVILLVSLLWIFNLQQRAEAASDDWLRVVLGHIAMARQPLLPSTWTAKGIVAAIGRSPAESLFYLAVVACNAAFLAWAAVNLIGRYWPDAFSRARQGRYEPTIRRGWFTHAVGTLLFFYLPYRLRMVMLKDLRGFARDATQWTQMVIMLGLLIVYVLNLPRLLVNLDNPGTRGLISFLNLTTVCLILATFTSRFVFPLLSLESQQLWLLGLLPTGRRALLFAKFTFALTLTLISGVAVQALAAGVLNLPMQWFIMHMTVMLGICCGLCGLSVGIGARFPVLGQRNPARIASGFGGTLNLICSMLFVLAEMAGVAYISLREIGANQAIPDRLSSHAWSLVFLLNVLSVGATIIPLSAGARHFRRLEV